MNKTSFDYIDSEAQLNAFCAPLIDQPWVGVDTEFMRERTYYAELSLIQIISPLGSALIDPLVMDDLSTLADVFQAPQCVKIFHAADQDIEVLGQTLDAWITPLFDTQLAAAFLGIADQIGYAGIVLEEFDEEIPKGQTRTNWHQRPLSEAQLSYAEQDVIFLPELYQRFSDRLQQQGRLDWHQAECQAMVNKVKKASEPDNGWLNFKGSGRLPADSQQVAKQLAVWREKRAQQSNRPREWILNKQAIHEIARLKPQSLADLKGIEGLSPKLVEKLGAQLLQLVEAGLAESSTAIWLGHQPLTSAERKLTQALMASIRQTAEKNQLASALLANRASVERLVRGDRDEPVLQGWRGELVGKKLLQLLGDDA